MFNYIDNKLSYGKVSECVVSSKLSIPQSRINDKIVLNLKECVAEKRNWIKAVKPYNGFICANMRHQYHYAVRRHKTMVIIQKN